MPNTPCLVSDVAMILQRSATPLHIDMLLMLMFTPCQTRRCCHITLTLLLIFDATCAAAILLLLAILRHAAAADTLR